MGRCQEYPDTLGPFAPTDASPFPTLAITAQVGWREVNHLHGGLTTESGRRYNTYIWELRLQNGTKNCRFSCIRYLKSIGGRSFGRQRYPIFRNSSSHFLDSRAARFRILCTYDQDPWENSGSRPLSHRQASDRQTSSWVGDDQRIPGVVCPCYTIPRGATGQRVRLLIWRFLVQS